MSVQEGIDQKETTAKKPKAESQVKKPAQLKTVEPEAAKLLTSLCEKANKKTFGRKVKESEILTVAIKLVKDEHIVQLQESTYSEQDKLMMKHADYQKTHGKLTLDQFIGKLMRGELAPSNFTT